MGHQNTSSIYCCSGLSVKSTSPLWPHQSKSFPIPGCRLVTITSSHTSNWHALRIRTPNEKQTKIPKFDNDNDDNKNWTLEFVQLVTEVCGGTMTWTQAEVEQKETSDIRSYHGTNAICGCWSKCVVVGVGSIYSSITVRTTTKAGEKTEKNY